MLSDDTVLKGNKWRIMKNNFVDMNLEYIDSWAQFTVEERKLLKELIKAQRDSGDKLGELKPTANPLYVAEKEDDSTFSPFDEDDKQEEEPTLDEVQTLHRRIS